MRFSQTIDKIAPALVKAQCAIRAIGKDKYNPGFKSKYVSLESITETVRPILTKVEISLLQGVERDEKGIVVETLFLHSSGEWVANTVSIPLEKATAQGAGSAITYGRRYGLSALLAITTDDDDDGALASQAKAARRAAPESAEINAVKAKTVADIPFPAIKDHEAWSGKPMKDVPTEVLEEGFRRASARGGKKAQQIATAIGQVLEDRRTETPA